jgi:hypothetical protein
MMGYKFIGVGNLKHLKEYKKGVILKNRGELEKWGNDSLLITLSTYTIIDHHDIIYELETIKQSADRQTDNSQ